MAGLPNTEGEQQPAFSGACACGQAEWSCSSSPQQPLDFCYCTTCQRVSGAPFVAWLGLPRDSITWHGRILAFRVCDFAARTFCQACGGTLTIQYECYPGKTHVAAGTIKSLREDVAVPSVGCHLFVRSKPAWYNIPEDGVARWRGFDSEFAELLKNWRENRDATG